MTTPNSNKEVIYRKVFIKSEKDLPQSDRRMYFVGVKDNLNPEDIYEWFNYKNPIMANNQNEYWINTFDWYLQEVQLPTQMEIEMEAEDRSSRTDRNNRDWIDGDAFDNFIGGAKWMLNKIKGLSL